MQGPGHLLSLFYIVGSSGQSGKATSGRGRWTLAPLCPGGGGREWGAWLGPAPLALRCAPASCWLPQPSELLRRPNHFSLLFAFNHKIILVPRSLPLGGTFVRDDISLIKPSASGLDFFPPRSRRSLPSSPGRPGCRLPAHAGFWSLRSPCAPLPPRRD